MATLAQFRAQFPEFASVTDSLINTMLAAAVLELDQTVWGQYAVAPAPPVKIDQGQMYLAAHKLAVSPFGQAAKLVLNNKRGYERTTYGAEFLLLQRGVVSGFRVA